MSIISIFVLLIILILAPLSMGLMFKEEGSGKAISFVYGFVIEWATFFVLAIPAILFKRRLSELIYFVLGVWLIFSFLGLFSFFRCGKRGSIRCLLSKSEIIYLGIFLALVAFQLYKAVFYAYADGDDSFYVATSQVADASDKMFIMDAYKGNPTRIEYRYALAPFPVWIALVSRLSGVNAATVSHVIIPLVFIPLTYIIYDEIAILFFDEDREKRYMFLCLVAVFEMFSNVSTSTSGTFLLTRARQGKEALACIVIPLMFLMIGRMIKSDFELSIKRWFLFLLISVGASLTSVFANMLIPFMILFLVICEIVGKCTIKKILASSLVALPNLCVALLYIVLD